MARQVARNMSRGNRDGWWPPTEQYSIVRDLESLQRDWSGPLIIRIHTLGGGAYLDPTGEFDYLDYTIERIDGRWLVDGVRRYGG